MDRRFIPFGIIRHNDDKLSVGIIRHVMTTMSAPLRNKLVSTFVIEKCCIYVHGILP